MIGPLAQLLNQQNSANSYNLNSGSYNLGDFSSGWFNNLGGGITGAGGGVTGAGSGGIQNPIAANSLAEFINKILDIVIQIGVPVLVVMIVFVGYKFVAARGNSSKLEEAKEAFKWTVIGAAIVLGAFVISSVIQTTVTNLGA